MKALRLASLALAVLITARLAGATENCARYLSALELQTRLEHFEKTSAFDFSALTTEDSLETLFYSGLPLLNRIAADNRTTIARVLEDQLALLRLSVEATAGTPEAEAAEQQAFLGDLHSAFDGIEKILELPRPTEKIAPQLVAAEVFLRIVSFVFGTSQLDQKRERILDPFRAFDGAQIGALFEALEDGAFDHVLAAVTAANAAIVPAPIPEPPEAPGVEAEPKTRRRKTSTPPKPPARETNLAVVLDRKLKLEPDVPYQARGFRQEYSVTFDAPLIKQIRGRHANSADRLLRSLFTGRGDNSGVMRMPDIGPKIVEVKTVMHGHFRILGCLDGADLRLIKMINIKESVAAYARRIPAHLCQ